MPNLRRPVFSSRFAGYQAAGQIDGRIIKPKWQSWEPFRRGGSQQRSSASLQLDFPL